MVRALVADMEQGALLMERLRPGRMLAEEVADDEWAARIAAGVMQDFWIPATEESPFLTMEDWAEDFGRIHSLFRELACPLPARTIERTEALFQTLLASQGQLHLLHGDLHHFNILSVAGVKGPGWKAIDPFGVVGEREVEVGAFMKNPDLALPFTPELESRLARRLAVFSEELGLDLPRLTAWSSVYAAVSAWWTISTGSDGWQVDAALADLFAGWLP
jgi:streptomycin 6-kinase